MAKPYFYVSSDYAGLTTDKAKFYFGYKETDSNDEWCFVAKIEGIEPIKVPESKLGAPKESGMHVVDCLIIGIGWVLTKYNLTPATAQAESGDK